MQHVGRILLIAGTVMALVGAFFLVSPKLPWLGKLPGDIVIQRKPFTCYFPLGTSILISVILSLLFWLLGKK